MFGPDDMALGIALDALQTAGYYFTGRRHFYREFGEPRGDRSGGKRPAADREAAIAAFKALAPYSERLRRLQGRCPAIRAGLYGARHRPAGLERAAFHCTRVAGVCGLKATAPAPRGPSSEHARAPGDFTRRGLCGLAQTSGWQEGASRPDRTRMGGLGSHSALADCR